MKNMKGETPGWHVVDATGAPVSGPWLSPVDATIQGARKSTAVAVVNWTGIAQAAEFPIQPHLQEAA